MRLAAFGLLALAFAVPSQAQDAPDVYRPSLRSTFVVPAHNARFWALTKRYPRAERARGYLLAKDDQQSLE